VLSNSTSPEQMFNIIKNIKYLSLPFFAITVEVLMLPMADAKKKEFLGSFRHRSRW
jgi:hypothetical protein